MARRSHHRFSRYSDIDMLTQCFSLLYFERNEAVDCYAFLFDAVIAVGVGWVDEDYFAASLGRSNSEHVPMRIVSMLEVLVCLRLILC